MRQLPLAFLLALFTSPLAAQTVTVTRPGAPPATFDCGLGCFIVVAAAEVVPPPCAFVVSPTALTVGADGAVSQVMVTPSRPDCAWRIVNDTPIEWLTATATSDGVTLTAAQNPSTSARSASLTIAGETVTVTQAPATPPPPCTWSLAPVQLSFEAIGGTQNVTVTPSRDGCGPFTTEEDVEWIALNGAAVTAAAHAGSATRTATVTIAGHAVTVTQVGVVAPPPPPPPTTLFRMDCGSNGSAWPRCGFDYAYTEREGTHFRRERLAGQAPSGRDAVRLTLLPASGQFEWGWIYTPRQAVPQGQARYIRWRFRPVSPIAWGGSARRAGGKLVILGNLCEKDSYAPTRVISNIEAPSNQFLLRTEQNINGAPSRFDVTSGIAADRWHSVQLKVQSSSSANASDGLLTMELDGRIVGMSSGGFRLLTAGWSTANGCGDSGLAFGNTFNALGAGQHFVLDVADFEYGTAHDPTWGTAR